MIYQREGGQPHELAHQIAHRAVVHGRRELEAGRHRRPDVRREVAAALHARVVRVVADVDRSDVEELFQVRQRDVRLHFDLKGIAQASIFLELNGVRIVELRLADHLQ